jgi:lipopolysaccharide/colanic/teichoic acid biosynthesis glycosyltransferase
MIRYNPHIKRIIDILLSSAALLALSPLLAVLSILICIESEGGPFFFQRRVGKGMVPFRLIKFRSMRQASDAFQRQFEPGESSRVTHLGELLRKTKLDELPELFNVLIGDMSIVGPRPEVEKFVQAFPGEFGVILSVRPGLSDYASIKYRTEEKILAGVVDPERYYVERILQDKMRLANEYIRRMSLGTDITIIARTIKTIRQGKEAEN